MSLKTFEIDAEKAADILRIGALHRSFSGQRSAIRDKREVVASSLSTQVLDTSQTCNQQCPSCLPRSYKVYSPTPMRMIPTSKMSDHQPNVSHSLISRDVPILPTARDGQPTTSWRWATTSPPSTPPPKSKESGSHGSGKRNSLFCKCSTCSKRSRSIIPTTWS